MTRRAGWLLAFVVVIANLASLLDRQTLSALAPSVRRDLHIDQAAYGWIQAMFAAAYFAGAPLAGRLLDRIGARRGLAVSVLVWSLISGLHAFVPGFGALLAARIALGLAEAPAIPGGTQVIVRSLPPLDRPRGLGLLFVGSSIGGSIAAPLATAIARAHGWRWSFLVTAALGMLWLPLWFAIAWRKSTRETLDRAPDTAAPGDGVQRTSWLATLREPYVLSGALVVLLVAPAVAFSGAWSAEMLVTDHHVVPNTVGHYLWLPPLGIDVGAILFGELAARRARGATRSLDRTLFVAAIALVAVGAWMAAAASFPWAAVAGLMTMMAGASAIYTLMLGVMTAHAAQAVSLAGGFLVAAQSLAAVITNPTVGVIVKRTHTFTQVLVGIGLLACVAGVIWFVRHRSND